MVRRWAHPPKGAFPHRGSNLLATLLTAALAVTLVVFAMPAAEAAASRSRAARAEFQRHHPCPSTGKSRGACPGYEVDHRQALVCGGADDPANMQWLSQAEHKAKTRSDIRCRRRLNLGNPQPSGV